MLSVPYSHGAPYIYVLERTFDSKCYIQKQKPNKHLFEQH